MSGTPQRPYGKYFLVTEADDEEYPESQVKFNTKIVTAKPRVRRKDFFDDTDLEIPEETPDGTEPQQFDDQGNPIEPAQGEGTPTDVPTDNQDMNSEVPPAEEFPQPEVQVDGTDVPVDTGTEETDDGPSFNNDTLVDQISSVNDEINNAEGNQLPTSSVDTGNGMVDAEINTDEPVDDGPVLDDTQTDPNAGNPDAMPEDPNAVPEEQAQKKGPGIEYDSTRKYVLFNKYLDLIAAIDGYIEKVEAGMADDYNINLVYKHASDELHAIRDLCYDYATIKFELMSYVQSLLFYQNSIVMIHKVFDMVDRAKNQILKHKTK